MERVRNVISRIRRVLRRSNSLASSGVSPVGEAGVDAGWGGGSGVDGPPGRADGAGCDRRESGDFARWFFHAYHKTAPAAATLHNETATASNHQPDVVATVPDKELPLPVKKLALEGTLLQTPPNP